MAEPRSNKKSFRPFELDHISPVQLLPYRMAEHRVSSQQPNPTSANTYPHPVFHQLQGQNPHVAGDHQEGVYREGVPQLAGSVVMQNEMQYPPHIDAPDYNVSHYHPPPPHVPQAPHVQTYYRDVRFIEPLPAEAHHFAPEAQESYEGSGAHFPAAGPPEAFSSVWPHPAPPADTPPAWNGLRVLAGRFLNNPGTLINMLRIEPGPGGRFEVWIALELADIYIY